MELLKPTPPAGKWYTSTVACANTAAVVSIQAFFLSSCVLFFFRVCVFVFTLVLFSFWTSRGHRCRPFSPPVLAFNFFIAHKVRRSQCSSFFFHRVFLTHALALSASPFVHKKKSPRIYTIMHPGGLELTKLTYIRLDDNLIRHRGDRLMTPRLNPFRAPKPPYTNSKQ